MEYKPLKSPSSEGPKLTRPSTAAPSAKGRNPLLSEECVGYLNYRVQQEEYSARIYLAMSMWLNNTGYVGAAKLWKKYSDEEMGHADFAREYLLAMGVQPNTPKLEAPTQTFSGLPEIIQQSFDHEIDITTQCKELATDALKKSDHMLYQLTLQYLKEQVEEHDKMQTWVDKLSAFGTDPIALRLLDNEMGS
tara:strand:- start:510 stop:1085 length:576 start_codon:yes stop_codon:yes gene_type:complete